MAFHTVFGKTVPDISLNAVANLGYAEGRWLLPVWPGDTLRSESEVIGLKETSIGRDGGGLGADARAEPARRGGAGVCPLGDGAEAAAGRGGAGVGAGAGAGG